MKKQYISPEATALMLFAENTIMSGSGSVLPPFGGGPADSGENL